MGDEFDFASQSGEEKISLDQVNNLLATKARRTSEYATSAAMQSPNMAPSSRRVPPGSPGFAHSSFDEAAWDFFIRSYEAELEQLRPQTVRFRHLGFAVDKVWCDLKNDATQPILRGATLEFVTWWQEMMNKAQEYEKDVRVLEPPQLEEVRIRRSSRGLPI